MNSVELNENETKEAIQKNKIKEVKITLGEKEITVQTGKLARGCSGSVTVQCGETYILVTSVMSPKPKDNVDFFPLLCDYEEKMSAVGRIPGSFNRREGKSTDKAILSSRLMDRPIRPLFPKNFYHDVQVVASVLSADQVNPPDVLAVLGASFALSISDAPFLGPIGAVRVGFVHNKFVVNPTYEDIEKSDLDIIVAGTKDSILMVEAGANIVSEETILNAIAFAQQHIKEQVKAQEELVKELNVQKIEISKCEEKTELSELIKSNATEPLLKSMDSVKDKKIHSKYTSEAKERVYEAIEKLPDDNAIKVIFKEKKFLIDNEVKALEAKLMRKKILEEGLRADGRKCGEIRPISCEVGLLPRPHGSGLFTRGTTQVLSLCTLGTSGDAQKLDSIELETEKKYMHNYNFPGFSVGEVKPMRTPGRREVGHGALAERAILPILPDQNNFPYTIRVVSEVLESNGSTSMASTCGSTLALMDAGVPITAPIAGVAMGLIKEGDKFAILTDIQGVEDFLGDMDFKVTGSKKGITALQMDIKIPGINLEIMKIALEQARVGRLYILEKMLNVLPKPRTQLSKWAPRIIKIKIDISDISTVIGPGGKMIRRITEETGAKIDIEQDGTVLIASNDKDSVYKAKKFVEGLVTKVQSGAVYSGKVLRTASIGAFVEILPSKEGLVHISQLQDKRTENVEDVVKPGDIVVVRVREVDERGRIYLTMRGITSEEKEKALAN